MTIAQTAVRQLGRSLNLSIEWKAPRCTLGEDDDGDPDGDKELCDTIRRRLSAAIASGDRTWTTNFAKTAVRALRSRYGEFPRSESFADRQFFPGVCAQLMRACFDPAEKVNVLGANGTRSSRSTKKRAREPSDEEEEGGSNWIETVEAERDERQKTSVRSTAISDAQGEVSWARSVGSLVLSYLGCTTPPTSQSYRSASIAKRGTPLTAAAVKFLWVHSEHLCDADWLAESLPAAGAWLAYILEQGFLSHCGDRFGPDEAVRLLCATEQEASIQHQRGVHLRAYRPPIALKEYPCAHGWEPFSAVVLSVAKIATVRRDVRRAVLRFCAQSVTRRPFLWNAHQNPDPLDFERASGMTTAGWWTDHPSWALQNLLQIEKARSEESTEEEEVFRALASDVAAAALWTNNVEVLLRMDKVGCLDERVLSLESREWLHLEDRFRVASYCARRFPTEYARWYVRRRVCRAQRAETRSGSSGQETSFCDLLSDAWAALKTQGDEPLDPCWDRVASILLSDLAKSETHRRVDWFRRVHDPPGRWWTECSQAEGEIPRFDELALACGALCPRSFSNLWNAATESHPSLPKRFVVRAFFSRGKPCAEVFAAIFGGTTNLGSNNPPVDVAEKRLSTVVRWLETDRLLPEILDMSDPPNRCEMWSRIFPGLEASDAHARPLLFAWELVRCARSWDWKGSAQRFEFFVADAVVCAIVLSLRTRPRTDVSEPSRFSPHGEEEEGVGVGGDAPTGFPQLPVDCDLWNRVGKLLPSESDFWFSRTLTTFLRVAGVGTPSDNDGRVRDAPLGFSRPERDLRSALELTSRPNCRTSVELFDLLATGGAFRPDRPLASLVFSRGIECLLREDLKGWHVFGCLFGGPALDDFLAALDFAEPRDLERVAEILLRHPKPLLQKARAVGRTVDSEKTVRPIDWLCLSRDRSPAHSVAVALEDSLRAKSLKNARSRLWRQLGVAKTLRTYDPEQDFPFLLEKDAREFPCHVCLFDFEPDQIVVSFSCGHPAHLACAHAYSRQTDSDRASLGCPMRCPNSSVVADSLARFTSQKRTPASSGV